MGVGVYFESKSDFDRDKVCNHVLFCDGICVGVVVGFDRSDQKQENL